MDPLLQSNASPTTNNAIMAEIEESKWKRLKNTIFSPWYKEISVEPTMFLYMFAFMITSVVEQDFFLQKACRVNNNFTDEICEHIKDSENAEYKKLVQVTTAKFYQWESIAAHVFPIILALFLGSFSDKRGRKLPLLMGLFGKFIYSVMIVVNAKMKSWPLENVIYTATLPSALTGADVAIFASCFAYISDISTLKNRTLRVTILDICYLSAMPTGVALGSYLFYNHFKRSYANMFALNASLLAASIIYTLIALKVSEERANEMCIDWLKNNIFYIHPNHECNSPGEICSRELFRIFPGNCIHDWADSFIFDSVPYQEILSIQLQWQTTPKQRPIRELGFCGFFMEYFDKQHVQDSIGVLVKKRPGPRRSFLILLLISMALYTFQRDEGQYLFIYTTFKFKWDVDVYSTFKTVKSSAFVLAMLLFVPLMNKVFNWRDSSIVFIGTWAHAIARLFYYFATTGKLFYVGGLVSSLGPIVGPMIRAMTSKVVPLSERGKVFALLSVCDNAVPFVSGVMYSQVYRATLDDDGKGGGGVFLLTIATQMGVFVLILIIHLVLGKNSMAVPEVSENETPIVHDAASVEKSHTPSTNSNTIKQS